MKKLLPLAGAFFLLILLGNTTAQTDDDPCAHPKDQSSINRCAAQQANQARDEMQRLYDQLMAKAVADSEASQKIRKAQEAWEAYQDAFLEAYFPKPGGQRVYGSMYSAVHSSVKKHLIEQHVGDLKELLTRYPD